MTELQERQCQVATRVSAIPFVQNMRVLDKVAQDPTEKATFDGQLAVSASSHFNVPCRAVALDKSKTHAANAPEKVEPENS